MLISVASSDDVKTGVYHLVVYPGVSAVIIKIGIKDDYIVEGTEAFGVQLTVPYHHKASVKLGTPSLANVFIKDGMFSFTHQLLCCYISTDDKPVTKPPTKPPTTHPPTKPRKICFVFLSFLFIMN